MREWLFGSNPSEVTLLLYAVLLVVVIYGWLTVLSPPPTPTPPTRLPTPPRKDFAPPRTPTPED